jgi:hypothetical protein
MYPTTTPRRSERTYRDRGAATAASFAQLRAARLAKLEKKDENAGAKAQQQQQQKQKQTKVNVGNNESAGAKAQQQKQQPPKSGPTQRKVLVEVHREAGRLILTIKGIKFTEEEKVEEKPTDKDVNAEGDPGVPAASPSGRSDKTEKDPAATSDKKCASGEDELPPLPRGVARCFVKGAAVKRKRAATSGDDCPKKRAAATKKAVRRLVKD